MGRNDTVHSFTFLDCLSEGPRALINGDPKKDKIGRCPPGALYSYHILGFPCLGSPLEGLKV